MANISLTPAMRTNLLSLQGTAKLLDQTQSRISTGLKVGSALDNPTAFFTAKGLSNTAGDMATLKDSMGQGISTIQAADKGLASITSLVDQMKGLSASAKAAGTATERASLAAQFDDLRSQIDALASDADYNGKNLISGRGVITGGAFTDTSATAETALSGVATGGIARTGTDTDVGTYTLAVQQKVNTLATSLTVTADNANVAEVFINGSSVGSATGTAAAGTTGDAVAALSSLITSDGAGNLTVAAGNVIEIRDPAGATFGGLATGLQNDATGAQVMDLTGDLGIYGAEVYASVSGYTSDATSNDVVFTLSGTTLTATDGASGTSATIDTSVFAAAGTDTLAVGDLTVNFVTSLAAEQVNTTAPVSAQTVAAVAQVDTLTYVGTFDTGDKYTITVNGADYAVTSNTGTTATTFVTDFLTANSSTGAAGGFLSTTGNTSNTDTNVVVTTTGAGVLVFTSQNAGQANTITQTENVDTGVGGAITPVATTANVAQANTLVLAGAYDDGDVVTATVNSNTISYTVKSTDIGANAAATLATVTNALASAINANTTLINGASGILASAVSDGTDTITFTENALGVDITLTGTNTDAAISFGNETNLTSTKALKSLTTGTADGDVRINVTSGGVTENVNISTTSTTAVTATNAAWGSTFTFTADDATMVAGETSSVTVANATGTGANDMTVDFNADGTASVNTQAVDASTTGLSISAAVGSWATDANIDAAITELSAATTTLRSSSQSLATNLGIIQTRENFTAEFINVLQAGSDKLTLADGNEEAANMLALQTRQQLGIQSLSMASQAAQSILGLFR